MYSTLYLRTPSEERFGWKFQFLTYINAVGINHRGIKYSRGDYAQAILSSISIGKTHESCTSRRKSVVHCSSILL